MSENDTDIIESQTDEQEVDIDTEEETPDETPAEEPKVEKPKETLEAKQARLKRELAQTEKKLGINQPKDKPESKSKAGELDETQLDYLDLKGVTESEDVKVIQDIVSKTGMTVRQALKDDYVIAKLSANKASREVKEATPSSNKRGGSQTGDIAAAVAKFDATGTLPDDFATRTAVVNAITERANPNKPAWHQ